MAIFQRTLTATAAAATVFAALAMPTWAQTPAAAPAAATSIAAEPAARGPGHHPRDPAAHEKRMAEKAQKFQTALQLTPAQQAQLQQVGQAELDRLAGMKEFALPFSLTKYLKQL